MGEQGSGGGLVVVVIGSYIYSFKWIGSCMIIIIYYRCTCICNNNIVYCEKISADLSLRLALWTCDGAY